MCIYVLSSLWGPKIVPLIVGNPNPYNPLCNPSFRFKFPCLWRLIFHYWGIFWVLPPLIIRFTKINVYLYRALRPEYDPYYSFTTLSVYLYRALSPQYDPHHRLLMGGAGPKVCISNCLSCPPKFYGKGAPCCASPPGSCSHGGTGSEASYCFLGFRVERLLMFNVYDLEFGGFCD